MEFKTTRLTLSSKHCDHLFLNTAVLQVTDGSNNERLDKEKGDWKKNTRVQYAQQLFLFLYISDWQTLSHFSISLFDSDSTHLMLDYLQDVEDKE